jgi:PAS domain S-box-containing protein
MSLVPYEATTPDTRFREVFEQAPISMQLIAASGRTIQVNKAWKTLWQGTFGDELLQLVLDGDYNILTDPQLREKGITSYLERAFSGESVTIPAILYDPRVLGIQAQPRWVTAVAHPIRNAAGDVAEIMLMHEDITDKVQAEEALRDSERRLRFVLDSMQQKIFTTTPAGDVDYLNPAWAVFTGVPVDDLRNWSWVNSVHPDDLDENIQRWRHSVGSGEPYEFENRFRRVDGEYRWHLSRAVPMYDENDRIVMWIGSNTDIHEVKLAESELERRLDAEQRHSAVLAKVARAAKFLHSSLSIEAIAEALVEQVRDILGVHQAVISLTTDTNWSQSINAVSLSDKYAAFKDFVAQPNGTGIYAEVCRTNLPMRFTQDELQSHPAWKAFGGHAAGHPPMRGWLAVPLVGHDGKNLGLIQVSDKEEGDFTAADEAILSQLASVAATGFENARLYASLQEQHRRKDEFLAMLAHELRNPLAPIRAAADLLSIADLNETRIRQTSEVISRQVQHMSSLVDDLLDVSRVTRGLIQLEQVDLDIKRIVSDAVEQVRPLVESKRHELSVLLSAAPAHVMGDHKRLVQILSNLLNNAAKYTTQGGAIHVRTETTDDTVTLTVQDNGIGIAPELQPYVFELFAQAERNSDRSQGGLGIGLALVKSLVELHGGQVRCESQGQGMGSRFIITLPRLVEKERLPHDSNGRAPGATAARKLRILIVDDNVDAAEMLGMFLELGGHEVTMEHRADSALQRARSYKPDVCILDIGLPDVDGNVLAKNLRALPETAQAQLIAVTGYGRDQDRDSTLAAGFNHHLVKPVDTGLLISLLDAAANSIAVDEQL